jgi:hypothetical protein
MIKLTVAFCNSAKAPKKSGFLGKKGRLSSRLLEVEKGIKVRFSYAALPRAALAALP